MQCFSLYVKDSIQHETSMSATFKAELNIHMKLQMKAQNDIYLI